MINKEARLKISLGNVWKYTCDKCPFVPDKQPILCDNEIHWITADPDYVRTDRISKRTGERGSKPLHYPDRCNSCKARYRRATRMGKRVDRIYERANSMYKIFRHPKLVTFAIPSEYFTWENYSSQRTTREGEIARLNSKLPRARKKLLENGIKGGTYVVECTEKIIYDFDNFTHPQYKFHAHVHMVCIGKYVRDLPVWCAQLVEMGLGRINYEAVKSKKRLVEYVSKYLVKDKQVSRTFGIMRAKPIMQS